MAWHKCHVVKRYSEWKKIDRHALNAKILRTTALSGPTGPRPHLSSSWLLWGGVGREAGTSTVLGPWDSARASSSSSALSCTCMALGSRPLLTVTGREGMHKWARCLGPHHYTDSFIHGRQHLTNCKKCLTAYSHDFISLKKVFLVRSYVYIVCIHL